MSLRLTLPYPVRSVLLKSVTPEEGQEVALPSEDNDYDANDEENEVQMLKNRIYALEASLQTARQEAFQMGFEEGQQAVEKKYLQAIELLPRQLAQAVNHLQAQYQETISSLEQPLVNLTLQLVDKILKCHLTIEDNQVQLLKNQVRYFLQQVQDAERITIYLSPSQMPYTRQPNFLDTIGCKVNFSEDAQLQPGECLVETPEFMIDGTIQGQLEQLARQLTGAQR